MCRVLMLWGALWAHAYCWAVEPLVAVLSSERSGAHAQVLEAVQSHLQRNVPGVSLSVAYGTDVVEGQALLQRNPRVLVALGAAAVRAALQADPRVPIVAALVPRSSFERLLRVVPRKNGAPVHALYLDQPFSRQLELIAQVLPKARRIGVLWGPETAGLRPAFLSALDARGWIESASVVADATQVGEGLRTVLESADAFLAVADPTVFNVATVSNILLGTYRAGVGVFAFAPAYTQAGAIASVYSTPTQIGVHTAEMVRAVLRGATPPAGQFPNEFQVSVNAHVAHSMGLVLDGAELTERIRRLENRP